MRIGDLAAAAGVSPDTIRHYERTGLLPPAARSANGYREFPEEALERLRVVRAFCASVNVAAPLAAKCAHWRRASSPRSFASSASSASCAAA